MVNDDFIREKLERRFAELFADLYDEAEVKTEDVETIYLSDKNNNELEYEVMDYIDFKGRTYAVVLPNDTCDDEGVVRIMRYVDHGEEGMELYDVRNDYVVKSVYNIFKERFEDLLNFYD